MISYGGISGFTIRRISNLCLEYRRHAVPATLGKNDAMADFRVMHVSVGVSLVPLRMTHLAKETIQPGIVTITWKNYLF